MSNALQAATAHFKQNGMREIEIPEWGLSAYFSPPTFAEAKRITMGLKDPSDALLAVHTIVEKLRDQDGKPLFGSDAETVATLQSEVDARVLQRILEKMGEVPDIAEIKNA